MAEPERSLASLVKAIPRRAPWTRELAMAGGIVIVLAIAITALNRPQRTPVPSENPPAVVAVPPMPDRDQDSFHTRPPVVAADSQLQPAPPSDRIDMVLRVDKGDTLVKILTDVGIGAGEANGAVDALRSVFNPRRLQVGQIVTVTVQPGDQDSAGPQLLQLALRPEVERDVAVKRGEDGSFSADEVKYALSTKLARNAASINDSLFADGVAAGVPVSILTDVIRAFSYDVDFQRDIHPSDTFEVVFERRFTSDGRLAREGQVLFAQLVLRGKRLAFYRYKPEHGDEDYYGVDGQSIVKSLLRTPLDGARISSTFGMRNHPILGYSRMHTGVDFAAPPGTPIFAAGNGTVTYVGPKGGYGNYVEIRHNATYATAYAHMSGYARGIHVGTRVRQGEIIGYVGSTGLATGPHLHYEVHKDNRPINPITVSVPIGPKLAGKELERFRQFIADFDRRRGAMPVDPAPAPQLLNATASQAR